MKDIEICAALVQHYKCEHCKKGTRHTISIQSAVWTYVKTGKQIVFKNWICKSGIDALSLSIISTGVFPISFSRSPCLKNSEYIITAMLLVLCQSLKWEILDANCGMLFQDLTLVWSDKSAHVISNDIKRYRCSRLFLL